MILDAFKLDGRVALVTGAARGLGQALALGLAEAGADIALLDQLSLDETRQYITSSGRRTFGLQADLQELGAAQAGKWIDACVGELGRLDILVNNAGFLRRSPALEHSIQDWNAVLSVNLSAAFQLSQAAACHFRRTSQKGRIINMASMLSFQGGLQVASYAAAKSGLAGLTRALANEWAGYGIAVNAIAPGYMATEMTAGLRQDPQRAAQMLSRIPAGRWGAPADLMGAIVFLASDAAEYVHGAILPVDGGWLAA